MVSGSFRKMFDKEEETKLSHYLKASILSHTQQKIEFNVCAYIRSDLSSYTVKIIYIFFVLVQIYPFNKRIGILLLGNSH